MTPTVDPVKLSQPDSPEPPADSTDYSAQQTRVSQGLLVYQPQPRKGIQGVLISPGMGKTWEAVLKAHFHESSRMSVDHPVDSPISSDTYDTFLAWARVYPPFVDHFVDKDRMLPPGRLAQDQLALIALTHAAISTYPVEHQRDLRALEAMVERFEVEAKERFNMDVVVKRERKETTEEREELPKDQDFVGAVGGLWVVPVDKPFEIRQSGAHEEVHEIRDIDLAMRQGPKRVWL